MASARLIPWRHVRNALLTHDVRTGCVFLPAAGNRNGSTVNNAGTNGNYWSSSPNASNVNNAYNVNFNSGNLNPANNNNRNNGHSVRLVRQVESTYPPLSLWKKKYMTKHWEHDTDKRATPIRPVRGIP